MALGQDVTSLYENVRHTSHFVTLHKSANHSVHTLPLYSFEIHFNIILPYKLRSCKWPLPLRFSDQNHVFTSYLSPSCHITYTRHPRSFDFPNNVSYLYFSQEDKQSTYVNFDHVQFDSQLQYPYIVQTGMNEYSDTRKDVCAPKRLSAQMHRAPDKLFR
jgi:hypothetical protein